MGAAMLKRENMVDFLRWRVSASREAVLAERVGGDVCGADFAPPGTVPAVHFRVTLEAPVALVLSFGVLLAEAGGGELGASGLGTRTRRLRRHPSRSLSAHGEALGNRASGSRGLFRANARIVCFLPGVSVLVSGRELKWAYCATVWHGGSRRPLHLVLARSSSPEHDSCRAGC